MYIRLCHGLSAYGAFCHDVSECLSAYGAYFVMVCLYVCLHMVHFVMVCPYVCLHMMHILSWSVCMSVISRIFCRSLSISPISGCTSPCLCNVVAFFILKGKDVVPLTCLLYCSVCSDRLLLFSLTFSWYFERRECCPSPPSPRCRTGSPRTWMVTG